MKLGKNRHVSILYALLNAREPLTSLQLAKESMSSPRTIKSDIAYLNGLLKEDGSAEIVALKAKGYILNRLDAQKYEAMYGEVVVLKNIASYYSLELLNRRLYIIQKLLLEDYCKVEDIAEELFVSKSTIASEIGWAVDFLKNYDVSVISSPGLGLKIQGKEQDIRSAMVEAFATQYHDFVQLYPVKGFQELFYEDREVYEEIRHRLLKYVRESRIALTDLGSKEVATHICLSRSRLKEGKHAELPEHMAQEIQLTYDYPLAKKILADDYIQAYTQADENEAVELARVLLTFRDIDIRGRGIDTLPAHIVLENSRIFHQLMEMTDNSLLSVIYNAAFFKFYEADFESLQLRIYLSYLFGNPSNKKLVTYNERRENYLSPLSMELARLTIHRLQHILGISIYGDTAIAYASMYDNMINQIDFPYKKLRLLLSSAEGLVVSQYTRQSLLNTFSKFIESIEVYNLYEMRKLDFSRYDAVVHSGFIQYYRYPLPVVSFPDSYSGSDYSRLFEELFAKGFSEDALHFYREHMRVYHKEKVQSLRSFLESLTYRYAADEESQERIASLIIELDDIITHTYMQQKLFLFFLPYGLTKKEICDLYILNQTIADRRGNGISSVLVCSFSKDRDPGTLRMMDMMLKEIVLGEGRLENLTENREETLQSVYTAIIQNYISVL